MRAAQSPQAVALRLEDNWDHLHLARDPRKKALRFLCKVRDHVLSITTPALLHTFRRGNGTAGPSSSPCGKGHVKRRITVQPAKRQ